MRKITVVLLLALLLPFRGAWSKNPAADFLASPAIDSLAVTVLITDLRTADTLCSINAREPFIPASVMKTVTIASLLREVGPDYRYCTPVMMEGEVCDSVLRGNILIIGSCDPSLGTKDATDLPAEICKALQARGIREITGSVVFDTKQYPWQGALPGWSDADMAKAYGTLPHGVNYEHNISGGSSVANPSGVLRDRVKWRLEGYGIRMLGENVGDGPRTPLLMIYSQPVDDLMRRCMMLSDNLYAECFLMTLAHEKTGSGTTKGGCEAVRDYWEGRGLDMDNVKTYDGSGLSRLNTVTALFITQVLADMADNPDYVSYFPLTGTEGTVSKFLKGTPLEEYMALKTGTLHDVMCFAGYKLDDDYAPTHTVVVLVNSLPKGRAEARNAVQKLLLDYFAGE